MSNTVLRYGTYGLRRHCLAGGTDAHGPGDLLRLRGYGSRRQRIENIRSMPLPISTWRAHVSWGTFPVRKNDKRNLSIQGGSSAISVRQIEMGEERKYADPRVVAKSSARHASAMFRKRHHSVRTHVLDVLLRIRDDTSLGNCGTRDVDRRLGIGKRRGRAKNGLRFGHSQIASRDEQRIQAIRTQTRVSRIRSVRHFQILAVDKIETSQLLFRMDRVDGIHRRIDSFPRDAVERLRAGRLRSPSLRRRSIFLRLLGALDGSWSRGTLFGRKAAALYRLSKKNKVLLSLRNAVCRSLSETEVVFVVRNRT